MGGNSSSRHVSVESEDAEGVVFVKGIRLTDRVVDRMKEPSPVKHPQSKSSTCPQVGQSRTPQSEALATTEHLAPKLPHPASCDCALVPPPVQKPISPTVPLVSVSQETPAPSTSTSTIEAVPSATPTESEPAPVTSVHEHVVTSTPTDSLPPAQPAEPLLITTSPLTFPETEPVDISPTPLSISALVMSSPPSEATTVPLTDDVLTAPLVKTISLPTSVEPIDIPVESAALSTPLTLDTNLPDKQVDLPTPPTSETEMPLSPDTRLTALIESVEILTDKPPVPSDLPNNPEDMLPPPPSAVLFVPCEVPSVGQIKCPPNEYPPAPVPIVEPAVAPVLPLLTETVNLLTSPKSEVNEEELRRQIREELQKVLREEMKMAELKIQQQLEEEKAKAVAEAQTKAKQQIQTQVQEVLEKEQPTIQQSLKDAIMQQRTFRNIQDGHLAIQYYIQKLEEKERDLAQQDLIYKEQIGKLEQKTAQLSRVTAESFRKGLEETRKRFKRYQIKPVCSELQSEILKCYLHNTGQSLTCSSIASQYVKCVNNAKQSKKLSTGG